MARAFSIRRPISVDLPTPGGPVKPTTRACPVLGIDLANQRPALRVVVLHERDRPSQRAPVAREQALGEVGGGASGGGMGPETLRRLRAVGRSSVQRAVLVLASVLVLLASALPAQAQTRLSGACPNVPVYSWQRAFVERPVQVRREADGRLLEATLFRPADRARYPGRRAAIVLMHGLGGSQCGQFWSARSLAGNGYVTLSISGGDDLALKVNAISSGISFLRSRDNPWRRMTRHRRIGAAGHSQGANAVADAQATDTRIGAIVAFDNLRRYAGGDPGVFLGCAGRPNREIVPRVPAMGQALDGPCVNNPSFQPPELKKAGFEHWRAAGIPTMQLVFRDAVHADWGGGNTGGPAEADRRRFFAYYARSWFNRFLLGRPTATPRLLAGSVLGRPTGDLISSRFLSGAAFPGAEGCEADLAPACPRVRVPPCDAYSPSSPSQPSPPWPCPARAPRRPWSAPATTRSTSTSRSSRPAT